MLDSDFGLAVLYAIQFVIFVFAAYRLFIRATMLGRSFAILLAALGLERLWRLVMRVNFICTDVVPEADPLWLLVQLLPTAAAIYTLVRLRMTDKKKEA